MTRWHLIAFVTFTTLLGSTLSPTPGQEKSTGIKWEHKAVTFGNDEMENTRKLNDLAADGWEYVGPLNSTMVAFKRPLEAVGLLYTLDHHTDLVIGVAFAPDGRRVLSASNDGTVRLVEAKTGKAVRTLDHPAARSVAYAADGKKALTTGDGPDRTVRLWDLDSGKELRSFGPYPCAIHGVAFSPDGKQALFGVGAEKYMQLVDLESGQEVRRCEGHTDHLHGLALSADGKKALSGSYDTTVRLWDVESGKELKRLEGHKDHVWGVALSPDGKRAASGGKDTTIKIWDLENGKEIRQLDGHAEGVHGLAFSRDGRWLASGGYDKMVRLWDVETGKELQRFEGHQNPVYDVAFSPDRNYLVTGGADKTVRVWRLPK